MLSKGVESNIGGSAGAAISVVAVPKPVSGHIGIIQRNAVASWRSLGIVQEIVLIGEEAGIAELAAEFGTMHVTAVGRDAYGTPQVDSVFEIARNTSSSSWLCYINADIILTVDFEHAVRLAIRLFDPCVVTSRRFNLDVTESLYKNPGWLDHLRDHAVDNASLFNKYGLDVFVFPREMFRDVPAFSIGRPYWDNWMIADARRKGLPVVDATARYGVIHQNHGYDGIVSASDLRRGQQGLRNFWLAGDSQFGLGHAGDATHCIVDGSICANQTKTVSVVIPHAGSIEQIRSCLRSLAHQSYPRTNVDVIVVDNGAAGVTASLAHEFPFAKVTSEWKRGPAAARNKGAAVATGDIIAFLDSDCSPAGNWIEKAVEVAQQRGLDSVVACNVRPGEVKSGSAAVGWYERLVYHNQKGFVETAQACITGGMVVPRSVWLKVGPFDERFPEAACEDWEWSTRASSSGVRIVYSDDAIVTHPVNQTWRALHVKARRLARGELTLARLRGRYRLLSVPTQYSICAARLKCELYQIFIRRKVPLRFRFHAALASIAVWFWSTSEIRRQLGSVVKPQLRPISPGVRRAKATAHAMRLVDRTRTKLAGGDPDARTRG